MTMRRMVGESSTTRVLSMIRVHCGLSEGIASDGMRRTAPNPGALPGNKRGNSRLHVHELLDGGKVDRFDEVLLEPGSPRPHAIGLLAVARESHEPDLLEPRNLTQAFRQLVAVHDRQANVDEGDVGNERLGETQGCGRIVCHLRLEPLVLEGARQHLGGILVVIDDEDAPRTGCGLWCPYG